MINMTLISSIGRNALVGAVATKIVDTLVTNKINGNQEHKKWIRSTKFELFSELLENISFLDELNFEERLPKIKKLIAKTTLLLENKRVTNSMQRYLEILHRYSKKELSIKDLQTTNEAFISYLKSNF